MCVLCKTPPTLYLEEGSGRREVARQEGEPDDEGRVDAEGDVLGLVEVVGQCPRLERVARTHDHEEHVVAQRHDEASLWHRARQLHERLHCHGHAHFDFRRRAQRNGDVDEYLENVRNSVVMIEDTTFGVVQSNAIKTAYDTDYTSYNIKRIFNYAQKAISRY